MTAICNCTRNKDLEPLLPFVVEVGQTPTNTNERVEKLAVCIFCADRGVTCLRAMLPILSRGLNDYVKKSNKLVV